MQRHALTRFSVLLMLIALVTACGGTPATTIAPSPAGTEPSLAAGTSDAAAPAASDAAAPAASPDGDAATQSSAAESAAPAASAAAAGDVQQVYAYINTGALNRRPEGSDPAKLAEMNAIISEATGVEIVPILPPGGDAAVEKLNLMLSSPNERLDLFQGDWTQYRDAVIPLNDLLEQHGQNILKAWPEASWARMTDSEGQIWGIPRLLPIATYPVWVRTDVLEALDMQAPTTVEELEAFMAAYQASDPTAIPLLVGGMNDFRSVLLGAFTEHGNSNWIDPADGKLKPAELQPGFQDWVAKMADWYAKGYIYKDTFGTTDGNRLREVVRGQKVGSNATWYSIITLSMPALNESNPEVAYEYTNITGPKGKAQTINPGGSNGAMITKRAQNPEAIIKFIDWQYASLDNNLTAMFGVQGEDWEYVDTAEGADALVEGTRLVKTGDAAETGYASEVMWAWGLPMERQYVVVDQQGKVAQHYAYLNGGINDISVGKMPVDAAISYDQSQIRQIFPNQQDFTRYVEENLTNFISGARPLSEWDAFIAEMQGVGLDLWIEAYSAQYQARQQ